MKTVNRDRRRFLQHSLMGAAGAAAFSSSSLQLANAAASSVGVDNYKALVCVFLYGGNDSHNLFIPAYQASADTGKSQARLDYEKIRGGLAYADAPRTLTHQENDLNMVMDGGAASANGDLVFIPQLKELKALYNQGHLAVQGNVGALVGPLLDSNGTPISGARPAGLFAHDAAQQNWMRGADLGQKSSGWAGRMQDLLLGQPQGVDDFMRNMSLSGGNFWQTSSLHSPYSIPVSGEIPDIYRTHDHVSWVRSNAIDRYHDAFASDHALVSAYSHLYKTAVANNATLVQRLAGTSGDESGVSFPNTGLANQLKTVGKLIDIGRKSGLKRQVFFVGLGGFDTHSNQNSRHPQLIATVSQAMSSFYKMTEAKGLHDQVTSFTMSDFGRGLRSNGNGTDHGWAGHQWILGGAVQGGKVYGDMPYQSRHTNITPTTSNEQMFASLARWFGVTDNALLEDMFPNLRHFEADSIDYFA